MPWSQRDPDEGGGRVLGTNPARLALDQQAEWYDVRLVLDDPTDEMHLFYKESTSGTWLAWDSQDTGSSLIGTFPSGWGGEIPVISQLLMQADGGRDGVFFDDISFFVPEPCGMYMLGIGALLALSRRRRRATA